MGRSLDQGFLARPSVAIIKNKPPDEIWKWKWIMRSDGRLKSPIKSRSSWHNLFDCPLAVRFENAGINLHFPLVLSPPIAHWDFIRLRMPILIYAQKQSLLFEWPANANFPPLWFFFWFSMRTPFVSVQKCGAQAKRGENGAVDSYLVTENSDLLPCFCLCSSQKIAELTSNWCMCTLGK